MYDEKDQAYFAIARRDVLPMVPHCARLLDVGCGTGATSRMLKSEGRCKEAFGIELFDAAAAEAGKHLDQVICADIATTEIPFANQFFDVILCLDVLEHLADPWSALAKLKRVLRDDGCLIASIPNIAYAPVLLKILFNRFEYADSGVLDKTHLRFFTLHTMKNLFADCGFVIEEVQPNRAGGWKIYLMCVLTLGLGCFYSVVQYKIKVRKKPSEI